MPGIGHDEDRPPRSQGHVLRTRPDQLRVAAVGIELAEDRQIDVARVQRGVGFRTRLNHPPLGRQAAQARGVLERLALLVGYLLRLLAQLAEERVEQCAGRNSRMCLGASGIGSG